MKLKYVILIPVLALLTACATMNTAAPRIIQVKNNSSNAARCEVVDIDEKTLAKTQIARGTTGQLTISSSSDNNALICKCADCKSQQTNAAFEQLSPTRSQIVLAGNPNKGSKDPYLLY